MEEFWILIFVALFVINFLEKAESVKVKLEETPLKTFDEIFGEGWWDKDEAEDLKMPAPTNFGQNVHHQIDRQNTQLGQIEPNSTVQLGQIEPNSTDQNPPHTKSDHSENAKNGEEQNEIIKEMTSNKKRKIDKFHEMKDEFKLRGKYSKKEWNQIEMKIAKNLKVSRPKIYKWKKEFGLSRRNPKNERKNLIEKFDQLKAELNRAGLKNSYLNKIDKTVAKELGLCFTTIYKWKRELGHSTPKHKYSHNEQKELMKLYYETKGKTPKISDEDIAKMLKIGLRTLIRWKKQFKRQQLHPNSVDLGHSVEENEAQMFRKLRI